jgi:hypothetical protein
MQGRLLLEDLLPKKERGWRAFTLQPHEAEYYPVF